MNHCLFAPDFNRWAGGKLQLKKKRESQRRREENNEDGVVDAGDKDNEQVRRPEGKLKLKMYVQYSDGLLKSIAAVKKELSITRVGEIYNNIWTREYKSSTIVTEEKKAS